MQGSQFREGRVRPPMNGAGMFLNTNTPKDSPSPRPKSMGSLSSSPACLSRLPVVLVSQCSPTNGA